MVGLGLKSIRSRIMLTFGSVVVVMLLLLGIVLYSQVQQTVTPLADKLSQSIVQGRAKELGEWLQGHLKALAVLGSSPELQSGQSAAIRAFLSRPSAYVDPEHEMVLYANLDGGYFSSDGDVGNISDRDYFLKIVDGGREYAVSNPLISRASGEAVVVIAQAVKGQDGGTAGIVAATVRLSKLSSLVADVDIESAEGFIVDATGLVVAHPNPDYVMQMNVGKASQFGFQGLDEIAGRMTAGSAGIGLAVTPQGEEVAVIYTPIPLAPGWALGTIVPTRVTHAQVQRILALLIWLFVGVILIVLIASFFPGPRHYPTDQGDSGTHYPCIGR